MAAPTSAKRCANPQHKDRLCPDKTTRKLLWFAVTVLVAVLAWIGTEAISQVQGNTQQLQEHVGDSGHTGTMAILERIEGRIERFEDKFDAR